VHEFSLASQLIERCEEFAGGLPVAVVRVRRSPAVGEAELRQAFETCAAGTMVEGARLDVEVASLSFECPCGFRGELGETDVVGHLIVCPSCAAVSGHGLGTDLDLLTVQVAANRSPEP
jgi:Zn finger protein HypA/HybF involved in hydrogenase expression